jgi:hypothetical protein
MWTAMSQATQVLVRRPADRGKWIVALTDGYSGHTPAGVQNALAQSLRQPEAEPIVVLTIAVNLARRSKEEIEETCIRGRNERCSIIAADGGVEALAAAWEEAGERLTVSQKVEQAAVTDDECRRLLTEYMHLEERGWNMMKQVSPQTQLLVRAYVCSSRQSMS